jgi:hypothetical protein
MDYITDSNRSMVILGAFATLTVCHALFRRWVSVVSYVPGPPSSSWLYGKSRSPCLLECRMFLCNYSHRKSSTPASVRSRGGLYYHRLTGRPFTYIHPILKSSVTSGEICTEKSSVCQHLLGYDQHPLLPSNSARITNRCFPHSKNIS